jgi:hypothetical protein
MVKEDSIGRLGTVSISITSVSAGRESPLESKKQRLFLYGKSSAQPLLQGATNKDVAGASSSMAS